jgi:galactokinase
VADQPGGRGPFNPLTLGSQKAALVDSEHRFGFEQVFGRAPAISASAPGRVNLIGDHTDYNGGFVFPSALPHRTSVLLGPRDDDRVRVVSASVGSEKLLEYQLGGEQPGRGWLDYVQGATALLRSEAHRCSGFDLGIQSEIPLGSGLASSAALVVAVLRALRLAFGHPYGDLELALIGQRVETEFVGAPVGVMDPMVCSLGESGQGLFIDTRSLEYARVPFPDTVEPLVISSGLAHQHATGDYRIRRSECERAAQLLGINQLRDLTSDHLAQVAGLPRPLNRRARHVFTEDQRVLEMVKAFQTGDVDALGPLLRASHASMRDDFEVSTPEIDLLVELGCREPGVLGARLTGGGFGGSVVMLAKKDEASTAGARIVQQYFERTGGLARMLVPHR